MLTSILISLYTWCAVMLNFPTDIIMSILKMKTLRLSRLHCILFCFFPLSLLVGCLRKFLIFPQNLGSTTFSFQSWHARVHQLDGHKQNLPSDWSQKRKLSNCGELWEVQVGLSWCGWNHLNGGQPRCCSQVTEGIQLMGWTGNSTI